MWIKREARFLLDPSAIQDGRAVVLFESGLLTGRVYLPDPESTLRVEAVDTVSRLKRCPGIKLQFLSGPGDPKHWAHAALKRGAKLITVDGGMKEVLRNLKGLVAVFLDDLYEGLRPTWRVGTEISLRIVKRGKEPAEGVGYLRDGTKVVVEGGVEFLGTTIPVLITGGVETPGGRLVFARPKYRVVR